MFKTLKEICIFVALKPFSVLYEVFVYYRNWLFDIHVFKQTILPGRVVSVGNIEVGGAGKTPLVKYIVEELLSAGHKPAVLSRGYKSGLSGEAYVVFKNGEVVFSSSSSVGGEVVADEALYLSNVLKDVPVIVGKKRSRNALAYYPKNIDISHWVLDDGFQHRQIHRDLDIVVLSESIQNHKYQSLLPYGRLREELSSLYRADIVLFRDGVSKNKELLKKAVPFLRQGAKTFEAQYRQTVLSSSKPAVNADILGLEALANKQLILISAVAHNDRVLNDLKEKKLTVKKTLFGNDHKKFDFSVLLKAVEGVDVVITTAKDYYRQQHDFERLNKDIHLVELNVLIQEKTDFLQLL